MEITKEQKKIYDFWSVRGYSVVKAVLGNLNVTFHREKPQYDQLGVCYQYLEQFYVQAKEDLLLDMLNPEIISKYGKTQEERMAINTYLRSHLSTF